MASGPWLRQCSISFCKGNRGGKCRLCYFSECSEILFGIFGVVSCVPPEGRPRVKSRRAMMPTATTATNTIRAFPAPVVLTSTAQTPNREAAGTGLPQIGAV